MKNIHPFIFFQSFYRFNCPINSLSKITWSWRIRP